MGAARLRSLVIVAVSMLVLWVQPADASPTTVSVAAGTLAVTSPEANSFAVIVLDGTTQATEAPLGQFSVTDARGSGAGWSVSVQATPFKEWSSTGYVDGGKVLPLGSLTLGGLSVAASGSDSDVPVLAAGPYVLDGAAVSVATAAAGAGMGTFVFTPAGMLRVTVPASAYARAYRSQLSISITSGP